MRTYKADYYFIKETGTIDKASNLPLKDFPNRIFIGKFWSNGATPYLENNTIYANIQNKKTKIMDI